MGTENGPSRTSSAPTCVPGLTGRRGVVDHRQSDTSTLLPGSRGRRAPAGKLGEAKSLNDAGKFPRAGRLPLEDRLADVLLLRRRQLLPGKQECRFLLSGAGLLLLLA